MDRLKKTVKGLWSLIVGLKVTGIELCKPWITTRYPFREVENISTYRGHIELVGQSADPGTPRCVICWTCSDLCPSRCITIRAHVVGEDPAAGANDAGLLLAPQLASPHSRHSAPPPERIERQLDVFHLNYSLCSLCGLCVQNCPVEAIRFSRNVYLVGDSRQDFEIDLLARLRSQTASRAVGAGCNQAA
jgi:NADH-quinone oxidoreductase subunit I